jgi:hypothetical protein
MSKAEPPEQGTVSGMTGDAAHISGRGSRRGDTPFQIADCGLQIGEDGGHAPDCRGPFDGLDPAAILTCDDRA